MRREGPDIINSMDPSAAEDLINGANIIYEQRGGSKGPVDEELPTIKFAFASVVSTEEIKKGTKLNKKNIWVKRPGTGHFSAEKYFDLIGKKTIRNIKAGEQIKKRDLKK